MLSKYFTALAAGTVVTGLFGLLAYAGYQLDQISTFFDRKIGATDLVTLRSNENRFYPEQKTLTLYDVVTEQTLPVNKLMACEETSAMTTRQYRAAFDNAARKPGEQLCLWAAFDPYKDEPVATAIKSGRIWFDQYESVPDSEEFAAQIYFQNAFTAPQSYLDWEHERMDEARQAIAAHPEILQARKNWLAQEDYADERQAREQHRLKEDTLRLASDIVRKSFGLEPVPLSLYRFDASRDSQLGAYSVMKKKIEINYAWRHGVTDTLEAALSTVLEEAKHSVDHAFALMLENGEMGPSDIRANHAAARILNGKIYIDGSKSEHSRLGSNKERIFQAYEEQYIERTAKKFRDELLDETMEDIACGDQGGYFDCFVQKFIL